MNIIIFKTNVNSALEVGLLERLLEERLKEGSWTFDLEDCDRILRVESSGEFTGAVVEILENCGFFCEEFPY